MMSRFITFCDLNNRRPSTDVADTRDLFLTLTFYLFPFYCLFCRIYKLPDCPHPWRLPRDVATTVTGIPCPMVESTYSQICTLAAGRLSGSGMTMSHDLQLFAKKRCLKSTSEHLPPTSILIKYKQTPWSLHFPLL